ncbi:MAG: hypothetical protein M3P45_04085 [Acidobacteriota bacterium]|nr:hypothetical protein [Acidobacteriota bacterium]
MPIERVIRTKSRSRSRAASAQSLRAPYRIFLLSPANAGGPRAQMIMSENASFILARRLRNDGLPIGELFSFISGLYFRGKLAYARTFASPPAGVPGIFVITAGRGLVPPETVLSHDEVLEIAGVPVDAGDSRYRRPLERDAQDLFRSAGKRCEVVLLGSIATAKYVEPLLGIFEERLLFPSAFVGRGDMSRGGLMLRAVREATELSYEPVVSAVRHGPRPPKLPKLPRL